jgi:hypothetical protein
MPTAIEATSSAGYAAPARELTAATTSRQAPAKIDPASAIIRGRRRPSASLATGTWATTTVAALASSSSPIRRAPMRRSFLAYGGSSQVKTPHPTAIGWAVSPGENYRLRTPPGIRVTTTDLQPGEAAQLAAALHEITQTTSATYAG